MSAPHAQFSFAAGQPVLDLPATLTGRLKPQQRDLLVGPEDLRRWFAQAGVTASAPRASQADLHLARELREAIYALAMNRIGGRAPPASPCAALNRIAAGKAAVPQLDAQGRVRLSGSTRALLVELARDAIRILGSADADRLRQCEGETCARLFIDTSRAGDRRWCSMSGCGNKAKVAEFRRRQRSARQ